MNNDELKNKISALLPSSTFEEDKDFLNVYIEGTELIPLMQFLRTDETCNFDFLFCLTCIDFKTHFMMVYHLTSKKYRHSIVVKAKLSDRENPQIESVSGIWKTANLQECEVFDLFGIRFLNHPFLRRLFMDDNWKGFPLRKDYVDENMIEL